jgi:hypothetical protein
MVLTFLVAAITLGEGRTHVLLGAVHLVIFAAFAFLALVPRAGTAAFDQPRAAFFSRFAARFSSRVLAGFFLVSFFLSMPLLMLCSE